MILMALHFLIKLSRISFNKNRKGTFQIFLFIGINACLLVLFILFIFYYLYRIIYYNINISHSLSRFYRLRSRRHAPKNWT